MSFLLPSDLGRLIYGYLRTSCSERLAEEFLNTSDSMKECRQYKHIGFDARVHDRTLTQMLNEYSLLSDLIFENCSENDRSHFNIVNKLQNLLKSRPQSSKGPVPANTIPARTSNESNHTSREPITNSFTHILNDTLNAFQEEDSTHRLKSPYKGSKSLPLKNTTSVSCTVAVIPNEETPIVDSTLSRNSPSVASTNVPINEEPSGGTSNPNTITLSELSPQFRNSPIFGIARSIPTPEKDLTARTSSPVKLIKTTEKNQCNTVTSNACSPRVPSPVNVSTTVTKSTPHSSPVQNFPQDMEIDDAGPHLQIPVFNVPVTPVKSDIIRERKSLEKLVTPIKSDIIRERKSSEKSVTPIKNDIIRERKSSEKSVTPIKSDIIRERKSSEKSVTPIKSDIIRERKSSEKLVTNTRKSITDCMSEQSIGKDSIPVISHKGIGTKQISAKHSPKQHERSKMRSATETCAKNLNSENSPAILQSPKPLVKILPKSQPKPSKNYSSTKDKNSIFTRPTCSGPVPWDYALRLSLNDGTTNPDSCSDVEKKECKKTKRKDPDIVTNSKADNNKRKHDRKSIVCKKKRKLEEAKKQNEAKKENAAEKSVDLSKEVSKEGADPSGIICDKNIDNTKQMAEKISEMQTLEKVDKPHTEEPIPLEPNIAAKNDGNSKDEDVFVPRLELTKEIVIFHRDAKYSSIPADN